MTTPPGVPPADPAAKSLPNSPSEFLQSAIAPFKGAMRVLFSLTPLDVAKQEKHTWYGIYTALGLFMAFSITVILAADGAPYVYPWEALWTYKFEFFITTARDWKVLLLCALIAAGALTTAALASWLVGKQLHNLASGTFKDVRMLVEATAIGAAVGYAFILLLVFAIGWLLFFFGVPIFIFGWLALAGLLAIPVIAWRLRRIYQRTSLPAASGWLPPTLISTSIILPSMLAAIFIQACLAHGFSSHGRTVNSMRNAPTVALVQACSKVSTDIVCAVTLFPGKWQDYELIGDWKLGTRTNPGPQHLAHSSWRPAKETDRAFALIKLQSQKDTTIELRAAVSLLCTSSATSVVEDDRFFVVQGRVSGEQHTTPLQMFLRIDNAKGEFANMLKQACISTVGI